MAKTKISTVELTWVFYDKLMAFDDCPAGLPIEILPDPEFGWSAVTNSKDARRHLLCASRVEALQKQLGEIYVLAKD